MRPKPAIPAIPTLICAALEHIDDDKVVPLSKAAVAPCRDPELMPRLHDVFQALDMRTYSSPADAQLLLDGDDDEDDATPAGSLVQHIATAFTMATWPPISLILLERPDIATGSVAALGHL